MHAWLTALLPVELQCHMVASFVMLQLYCCSSRLRKPVAGAGASSQGGAAASRSKHRAQRRSRIRLPNDTDGVVAPLLGQGRPGLSSLNAPVWFVTF